VRVSLECLKELSDVFLPLQMLVESKVRGQLWGVNCGESTLLLAVLSGALEVCYRCCRAASYRVLPSVVTHPPKHPPFNTNTNTHTVTHTQIKSKPQTRQAIDTVHSFTSSPHPAVAASAARLLAHWRGALAGHAHVLACPSYVSDPVGDLESEIAAGRVPLPTLPAARHAQLAAAAASAAAAAPRPGGAAAGGFLTPGPGGAGGGGAQLPQAPASAPAGAHGAEGGGAFVTPGEQLLVDQGAGGYLGVAPMQTD
jgi:hypothetical protein